ncbi:Altered inheritance of mitochondria protein 32 [Leucoagaricus sp. SymC.cos]|nr:Altered inheritance of mitochondria protein 32 [Leucoagaricus sp. SymC.cos]
MTPKVFRAAVSCVRMLSTEVSKPLYGTVASHSSYVFLHSNEPSSEFPVKISTVIQRELQLRTMKLGTIVNFTWTGSPPNLPADKAVATVFSRSGGRLELPEVSLENVNDVEEILKAHIQREHATPETQEETHLYVCTHGARDCRCGEHGSEVARLLREEVERRRIGHKLKVREVGHVGGHKYAANLLIYPHGEWLGQLRAIDVPQVIDSILTRPTRPFRDRDPPILPDHWRGRMGLGKDEQISIFEEFRNRRNT